MVVFKNLSKAGITTVGSELGILKTFIYQVCQEVSAKPFIKPVAFLSYVDNADF